MVIASRPSVTATYAQLVAHQSVSDDVAGDYVNSRAVLKNVTATAPIMLGGPETPLGQRFLWDPADGSLSVELEPGESLWASATTDQTVHVLANGR